MTGSVTPHAASNFCRTASSATFWYPENTSGIDPKSLDISIQQNLLTVAGRREIPTEERATYYRQERFGGEFHRVIALPEDIDPDRVHARYQDGIVQIGVERREAARPRQIEIR